MDFTLNQEQFATLRVALLTIGQLTWQAAVIERAFAPRQIARFAGSITGSRCVDSL